MANLGQQLLQAMQNMQPQIQTSALMFPTERFDGRDRSRSIAHWNAFETYVRFQRAHNQLQQMPDVLQMFALTLSPPASVWLQGVHPNDLDDLKRQFLSQYSKWGHDRMDFEQAWNSLSLDLVNDDFDSWISSFEQLAQLTEHNDAAKRLKVIALLPPELRLHTARIDAYDNVIQFIKRSIQPYRDMKKTLQSTSMPALFHPEGLASLFPPVSAASPLPFVSPLAPQPVSAAPAAASADASSPFVNPGFAKEFMDTLSKILAEITQHTQKFQRFRGPPRQQQPAVPPQAPPVQFVPQYLPPPPPPFMASPPPMAAGPVPNQGMVNSSKPPDQFAGQGQGQGYRSNWNRARRARSQPRGGRPQQAQRAQQGTYSHEAPEFGHETSSSDLCADCVNKVHDPSQCSQSTRLMRHLHASYMEQQTGVPRDSPN